MGSRSRPTRHHQVRAEAHDLVCGQDDVADHGLEEAGGQEQEPGRHGGHQDPGPDGPTDEVDQLGEAERFWPDRVHGDVGPARPLLHREARHVLDVDRLEAVASGRDPEDRESAQQPGDVVDEDVPPSLPCKPARTAGTYRVPWVDLLKKVFAVDVLACPSCGGRLQVIAFIAEALVAARILDHLGLDSCGPPLSRAQAPPELFDPGPSYDAALGDEELDQRIQASRRPGAVTQTFGAASGTR